MKRIQHSFTLSDAVWRWGQEESGLTNPASWFRELINDARVAALAQAPEPPEPPKRRWDKGTEIQTRYDRKCHYRDTCRLGGWLDEGDTAVIFTIGPRGQKALAHPECHKAAEPDA